MMGRVLSACVMLALFRGVAVAAEPGLHVPAIFADHMVLQREMKVPVWGWAAPGETITVKIANQRAAATTDDKGKWEVRLDPMKAGGPFTMTIEGEKTITIRDILVGEVWLCSGQSNMAMTVGGCKNAKAEILASKDLTQIRHFGMPRSRPLLPSTRTGGRWHVCSGRACRHFTATGFFFGRKLHEELKVPIGLVNSSVRGTSIRLWTNRLELEPDVEDKTPALDSPEVRKVAADYYKTMADWRKAKDAARKEKKPAPPSPRMPSILASAYSRMGSLYKGMIYPLIPYGIRGAIWYQGESDAGRAYAYRKELPDMIKGWREVWGQGDFPFIFVQLPNFRARVAQPSDAAWAVMRESMDKTLALPNTGMAVTIDAGEADNIHPKDKQTVGQRLALCALATVYGKDIAWQGPTFDKMKADGGKVTVSFKNVGGGLTVKGDALKGFALAGEDQKWAWAEAKVEGDTVVLTSKDVAKPVAVRYAWAMNPECNLYSKEGLPARPFRTDTWPVATQPKAKE